MNHSAKESDHNTTCWLIPYYRYGLQHYAYFAQKGLTKGMAACRDGNVFLMKQRWKQGDWQICLPLSPPSVKNQNATDISIYCGLHL